MEYRCTDCFTKFYKDTRTGRKPKRCQACRDRLKEKWRKQQENK